MKVKEKADSSSLFTGLHVNASPRGTQGKMGRGEGRDTGTGRRGDTEKGDISPRARVPASPCPRITLSPDLPVSQGSLAGRPAAWLPVRGRGIPATGSHICARHAPDL